MLFVSRLEILMKSIVVSLYAFFLFRLFFSFPIFDSQSLFLLYAPGRATRISRSNIIAVGFFFLLVLFICFICVYTIRFMTFFSSFHWQRKTKSFSLSLSRIFFFYFHISFVYLLCVQKGIIRST